MHPDRHTGTFTHRRTRTVYIDTRQPLSSNLLTFRQTDMHVDQQHILKHIPQSIRIYHCTINTARSPPQYHSPIPPPPHPLDPPPAPVPANSGGHSSDQRQETVFASRGASYTYSSVGVWKKEVCVCVPPTDKGRDRGGGGAPGWGDLSSVQASTVFSTETSSVRVCVFLFVFSSSSAAEKEGGKKT